MLDGKGIRTYLHSCGDVAPLIPELVEMGLDALNPLEVKAGVDPLAVKKRFGDRLVLHGGFSQGQSRGRTAEKNRIPSLQRAASHHRRTRAGNQAAYDDVVDLLSLAELAVPLGE